jgi:hypothetical protein
VDYDVTSGEAVRKRMLRDLGRVATPAIVIGKRVFWGFEENRRDIADLLGVSPLLDAAAPDPEAGSEADSPNDPSLP